MKRFLTFLFLCVLIARYGAATPLPAENDADYNLVVSLADGSDVTFLVSNALAITFNDNTLSISNEDKSGIVDFCDIKRLRYAKSDESSIELIVSVDGNRLNINGQGSPWIEFYALDGRLLRSVATSASQGISLDGLHGIVIVKIGSKSIKLNVR